MGEQSSGRVAVLRRIKYRVCPQILPVWPPRSRYPRRMAQFGLHQGTNSATRLVETLRLCRPRTTKLPCHVRMLGTAHG